MLMPTEARIAQRLEAHDASPNPVALMSNVEKFVAEAVMDTEQVASYADANRIAVAACAALSMYEPDKVTASPALTWQDLTDMREALHDFANRCNLDEWAKETRLDALEARLGAMHAMLPNPLEVQGRML